MNCTSSASPSSSLSAIHWSAVEPLLDAALDLPLPQRHAFVRASQPDNAAYDDIMAMLEACERLEHTSDILSQPAAERFLALCEKPLDTAFAQAIANRFTIEHEAGRGGMGVVFRAHDLHRQSPVALKVLRTMLGGRGPARFRREIEVASRLQHVNIVPLYDSGEDAGRLWYSMPFLEGETLGVRLRREGMMALPDVVSVLRDIVAGLAYAHDHGIVHRDLKPENIMRSPGRAVICDFGVARALVAAADGENVGAVTTAGTRVGTLSHMAPEQATGDAIDQRADLYALGVVAYQMLTGTLPFAASTRQGMLTALLSKAPPPLSQHRRGIPAPLEQMVMRLLAKSAADRPGSAREVLAAL